MKKTNRVMSVLLLACTFSGCGKPQPQETGKERVVSLAPNMTEIVCAIGAGDLLVGRTTVCNFPPEIVSKVPVIGDFGVPSFESVIAARPTMILEVNLQNAIVGRRFDEIGLKRLRVPCSKLNDIPLAIRSIGILLHKEPEANLLADDLVSSIEELKKTVPRNNRPKVFVEISGDPLITVGSKSFISELISLAGGENIGDKIARSYFEVSSEWVITHNPDVILCMSMTKTANGSMLELVRKRPGWQGVSAVRNDRIYDNLNHDVIARPGPRVLQGIDQLRECIAGKRRTG